MSSHGPETGTTRRRTHKQLVLCRVIDDLAYTVDRTKAALNGIGAKKRDKWTKSTVTCGFIESLSALYEVLRGDEFIQIYFGEGFERFNHSMCSDIGVVRNEQRVTTEKQGGMVITTGMAMFSILMMLIRARRAVVMGTEMTDLVGRKIP